MARVVSVTANLHGIDLGAATRAIEETLAELSAEPGARTTLELRGQAVPLRQLVDGFSAGLGLAVVAIFLMLVANFQSLRLALAVVSTAPAVVAGVALALWLTGTTLNIQSAMGAIMAVGVAVANAILLVSFAQSRWQAGRSADEAAIEGAQGRLRPILMTSAAMIAGMVPMALALGEGGEQTAPLGRAVIGGLIAATVATLFILPTVFALVKRRGHPVAISLDPDDPRSAYYDRADDGVAQRRIS
jgi:multidrug efflux pump subunit AcrB